MNFMERHSIHQPSNFHLLLLNQWQSGTWSSSISLLAISSEVKMSTPMFCNYCPPYKLRQAISHRLLISFCKQSPWGCKAPSGIKMRYNNTSDGDIYLSGNKSWCLIGCMLSNFVKLQLSFWIFRLHENAMRSFPLGKSVLFNSSFWALLV